MPSSIAFKTAAAASALLFSAPALAALNKPVLFSDGLSPHVDQSLWDHLTPTQSTWDQWGWGWIPQACFDAANSNNVSPYDVEVFNVHYTDCSTAWTFCRHHNSPLSQVDMIDVFGRLPVHERQWVRHVAAFPGGGSAYAVNGDIVMQGKVGVPSVFQHETGHVVDAYKTGSGTSSATSAFNNAIGQDSCVPDAYANTNNAEDYTQVGVLSLYEIVNPGGLDPIGANWRCLVNQKNVLDGFQRDAMIPGGTCQRRWADSTIVSMGPAAGNSKRALGKRRTAGPKPQIQNAPGAPGVENIPFSFKTEPFVFQNLVQNATASAAAVVRQNRWQAEAEAAKKL